MSVLSDLNLMAAHCGYLARLYANGLDEERARAFAIVSAHFGRLILDYWQERLSGMSDSPRTADALTCSDYEAETPIGQALMDGADLAELGD